MPVEAHPQSYYNVSSVCAGESCARLEAHTTLDFRDNSSSHLFPRFHITNVQNSLRTPQESGWEPHWQGASY